MKRLIENNIIRKRTSIISFIAFDLVDFQSPSGILSNVCLPIWQVVLLALWEIVYILLLLIYVLVKCICRFVVVLLELKDVDIDTALHIHSAKTNVGNIFFIYMKASNPFPFKRACSVYFRKRYTYRYLLCCFLIQFGTGFSKYQNTVLFSVPLQIFENPVPNWIKKKTQ